LFFSKNVKVDLNIKIPMHLRAEALILSDTAEWDFGKKQDNEPWISNISGGFIRAQVENAYPFDAVLELELLDAAKRPLRIITRENELAKAGIFNANHELEKTTTSTLFMTVNQNIIDDLYAAKFMIIRFTMKTPDGVNSMKIVDGQKIKLKLIGDFTYEIQ
jgi:hypothetical protein